jgi:hypothetical protein
MTNGIGHKQPKGKPTTSKTSKSKTPKKTAANKGSAKGQ